MNVDYALDYINRGWYIFPVRPDKRPMTRHGFKDATIELAEINRIWGKSNPAICVDCGRSGLVVVDLDNKHDTDGFTSFDQLGIDHSQALHTKTPSGGQHLIFKDSTGGKIRNSASKIAPGVDIRANGGYVILPPSKVKTGEYVALDKWQNRDPGKLPKKLEKILLARSVVKTEGVEIIPFQGNIKDRGSYLVKKYLKKAHPGTRNHVGYQLACKLRDDGISKAEAINIMRDYARRVQQVADDRYTEQEAIASLHSAFMGYSQKPAIDKFKVHDIPEKNKIDLEEKKIIEEPYLKQSKIKPPRPKTTKSKRLKLKPSKTKVHSLPKRKSTSKENYNSYRFNSDPRDHQENVRKCPHGIPYYQKCAICDPKGHREFNG
ncbi:MAG: bifunctional DNA primase/polymerase [Pelolinea sp.]|nr:bifunctional DNA primase/polymerase [Pelolinea sp.]